MPRFSKARSFWQGFWSLFGLDNDIADEYFPEQSTTSDPVIGKFIKDSEKEEALNSIPAITRSARAAGSAHDFGVY